MTAVDRGPTRVASAVAIAAATVAVVVPGLYSWLTLAVGTVGFLTLCVGLVAARQAGVTVGAAGLFVGVLLAGVDGAPAPPLLLGAVAAILAWEGATTALGVGEQLGRDASTRRVELVRVMATVAVGGVSIVVAYGIYTAATWGASLTGVLLLVLAVVLLAAVLR